MGCLDCRGDMIMRRYRSLPQGAVLLKLDITSGFFRRSFVRLSLRPNMLLSHVPITPPDLIIKKTAKRRFFYNWSCRPGGKSGKLYHFLIVKKLFNFKLLCNLVAVFQPFRTPTLLSRTLLFLLLNQ